MHNTAHALLESLQHYGYARIALEGESGEACTTHAVKCAQCIASFMGQKINMKSQHRISVNNGQKYIGYSNEGPRQFFQVTSCHQWHWIQILKMDPKYSYQLFYVPHMTDRSEDAVLCLCLGHLIIMNLSLISSMLWMPLGGPVSQRFSGG